MERCEGQGLHVLICWLKSGVVWRCWDDGCAIFSCATSKTVLLSPEYAPILQRLSLPPEEQSSIAVLAATSEMSGEGSEAELLEQLVRLELIEFDG